MVTNPLRRIPSVSELLESPPLQGLVHRLSHNVVVSGVRTFLEDLRGDLKTAAAEFHFPSPSELAERIAQKLLRTEKKGLRPVINATGILLHTNLGRAPLAEAAIEAMAAVARDYANVEMDLESGERSHRVDAVAELLKQATGADAAAVVNNNAAATMIVLCAIAAGREVIVSRGQLIEIGGSFRLPDVMSQSGATLREVGTTNKTKIADYEAAIGDRTAALMRVHTSNFRVVGFTQEAELSELVRLGRARSLPVIDDIGSGALVDFARFGLTGEPVAAESVRAGADLVLFSGDKLLGGPQCGIIVGKKPHIDKIAKHPLMRALRVDKLTLAALAATLRLYRDLDQAINDVPLLQMLDTKADNLRNRAERLAPQMAAAEAISAASAVADVTFLGGGSVPTQQLATWCVALAPARLSVDQLARQLRLGSPAVVGRVKDGRLLLDLRSVPPRLDRQLVAAVEGVGRKGEEGEARREEGDEKRNTLRSESQF